MCGDDDRRWCFVWLETACRIRRAGQRKHKIKKKKRKKIVRLASWEAVAVSELMFLSEVLIDRLVDEILQHEWL